MNRILQVFKIKDLRKKVLIVLGLLAAYRILAAIPIPGVDAARLASFFGSNQLFGFLNLFSGGGLDNLSLAMLGVGPYITSTIIMQLLTIIFPNLKEMYYEDGERGKAKFNRISRYLTIPLAIIQSYAFLNLLTSQGVIDRPDTFGLISNITAITAGSMIALWLGELISEQKIGNGISLIILAGILSGLPTSIRLAVASYSPSQLTGYVGFLAAGVLLLMGIVYLNEGERKIPIAYARRVRGNKLYGGSTSYLPLKVNQAGMIPLIFAVSILLFPQFIAQMVSLGSAYWGARMNDWVNAFSNNQWAYGITYFLMVFFFTFFYSSIMFNPEEVSKNLQKSGGFVPGIRPGEGTKEFFSRIVSRITVFGATSLGLIAVIPMIIQGLTNISALSVSGTAMIIVVGVVLDSMRQINSQLTVRGYQGLR